MRTSREQLLLAKTLQTDRGSIDIKNHFISFTVSEGRVTLFYCPTDDVLADIMTKPVNKLKLKTFETAISEFELCKTRVHIHSVVLLLCEQVGGVKCE